MNQYVWDAVSFAGVLTRRLKEVAARRKFELGRLVTTSGVRETLEPCDVITAFCRHATGDWGKLPEHDLAENELALATEGRLFSEYYSRRGVKFWVITESDRSVTTVLLPSEY
jgi:hypothetical protein